ncbi:hypothetical protein NPIL_655841 [Nephila pilipes]|uniref:Uncharacterized protein n=1 Tax=Nephila pilipes TaxID=299642 RepID=A0A8X6I2Y9_NEPPI|nr:hypothetical protein NPIL_655841 [Nephila pilipes]
MHRISIPRPPACIAIAIPQVATSSPFEKEVSNPRVIDYSSNLSPEKIKSFQYRDMAYPTWGIPVLIVPLQCQNKALSGIGR